MPDRMTPQQRYKCMSHNRANNTRPELILRRWLWHRGYRFRLNVRRLPGSPDIVLSRYHTAIFVHGCFWHGHNGCKYYTVPKTNTDFWVAKVARNQERDQDVWRQLEAKGWHVIIVWECQLKKADLEGTIDRVVAEIKHNGEIYDFEQEGRRKARIAYQHNQRTKKEKERDLLREVKSL